MIKLIVFDLDGVLVDSRDLHYYALNDALASIDPQYVISRDEHLSTYDGLPTSTKLQMLTVAKGLPVDLHQRVWELKQEATILQILKRIRPNHSLEILTRLQTHRPDIQYYVASNCVAKSLHAFLEALELAPRVTRAFSNEDVCHPKPHPEIYLRCMLEAGVKPSETLIIEDSHKGRAAALESGAHLLGVENAASLSLEDILEAIQLAEYNNRNYRSKPKWQGNTMNVLIPMAGAGSRFEAAGFTFPKPLIEIHGKPMIQTVVENLNMDAHFIYIVQAAHYEKYNLRYLLNLLTPGCDIIQVDGITEGAACTTLLAKDCINNDEHLVLANSDQFAEWDSNEFMYSMISDDIDAGILTFRATHPKWSFVRLDEHGYAAEVAEKRPISDIATVGIYYWKHGKDYVKYAEQMIEKNIRTNGEFYVCPVFNEAIEDQKKIRVYPIERMWGLGTPEDLDHFLKNGPLS